VARVIRVFLDNALRHGAPPDSTVTLAIDAVGGRARVRVTDAGPGVPEADRERVFGRFERGATAGSGSGLGLAIARGLTRHMGGDVRVHPAAPGACFEATLPGCAAPPGTAPAIPAATGAPEPALETT
jgi:signal transduction histidine kinase